MVNGDKKDIDSMVTIAANQPEIHESPQISDFFILNVPSLEIFLRFQEKEAKSNYHNLLMKFSNQLIKVSLLLKNVKPNDQAKKLKEYLQQTNMWLKNNKLQMREEVRGWKSLPKSLNLFEGVLLPFASLDEEWQSNLVVRIVEEDYKIFITRKRVPYRVLVETIE